MSIERQCELIGLLRSSYYRKGCAEQEALKNLEIMNCININLEYTAHPFDTGGNVKMTLKFG